MFNRLILFLVFFIFAIELGIGQNEATLQTLDDLLVSLHANRGDVLFPRIYENFRDTIYGLKNDSTVFEKLPPEKIQQLVDELKEWIRISGEAVDFLNGLLQIRDAVIEQQAEEYAPELLNKAEEKLQEAAWEFQKGNLDKAGQKANEARMYYSQAEIEAIRNSLLGQIRILLQESADLDAPKYTPRSYLLVRQLLEELEQIIENNQFEDPTLPERSQRLEEEARHLLYLTRLIRQLREKEGNTEEFLLELENKIQEIAREVDYAPRFSEGLLTVLEDIRAALENRNAELEQLRQRNEFLEEKNKQLEAELQKYRQEGERRKRLTEKIEQAKEILNNSSAHVIEKGENLIIEVDNFEFPVGRYDVSPQQAQVLNKTIQALKLFPGAPIRIQFIQIAPGNLLYNQNLATKRAQAVKSYLQAHMLLPDNSVEVVGVAREPSGSDNGYLNYSKLEIIISLINELP